MYRKGKKGRTHCNPENFRMIRFVVIPVESPFSNCEGSLDRKGVVVSNCGSGKKLVNMIHGWYNGCDVGCPTGKK